MKIKKTAHLTAGQKKQAEALMEQCRQYEPVTLTPSLSSDTNFDPYLPCFFLLKDQDMLLSFLALFLPDKNYGEAIGFTHPAARGRGYFTRLWEEALDVLDERGILEDMELLLVTDGKSPDAKKALKAMEGEYQYSEYFLEKSLSNNLSFDKPKEDFLFLQGPLSFSPENLSLLSSLHEQIFCNGKQEAETFIQQVLCDSSSSTYVLYKKSIPMGLFHLTIQKEECYLSGFGIHPDYQEQGYGTILLHMAEKEASALSHTLFLQVGDYNEAAFSLYTKHGFKERRHLEYYY